MGNYHFPMVFPWFSYAFLQGWQDDARSKAGMEQHGEAFATGELKEPKPRPAWRPYKPMELSWVYPLVWLKTMGKWWVYDDLLSIYGDLYCNTFMVICGDLWWFMVNLWWSVVNMSWIYGDLWWIFGEIMVIYDNMVNL